MYKILTKILTLGLIHVDHIDPREVAAIVERAWIDNVENPQDFGYAIVFAHKRFNEVVSDYVRRFHDKNGVTPAGDHYVSQSPKSIYFAPRLRSFQKDSPRLTRGFFRAPFSQSS